MSTPRQFRHLNFIGQFTTHICHFSGDENVVVAALSRVDTLGLRYDTLWIMPHWQPHKRPTSDKRVQKAGTKPAAQKNRRPTGHSSILRRSGGDTKAILDGSLPSGVVRQHLQPSPPRDQYDGQAHSQRYVWPSMRTDCRNWARTCVPCQRAKITRQVAASIEKFTAPSRSIRAFPPGYYRYAKFGGEKVFTCVDRFTC